MGYFRLFRRIKIAPGVTVNISKSGLSTSFGPKGAKVTVGRRGVRRTVGIPGTGIYYTSTSSSRKRGGASAPTPVGATPIGAGSGSGRRPWIVALLGVVIVGALVGSFLGGKNPETSPAPPQGAVGLLGQAGSPGRSETPTSPAEPTPTTAPRPPAPLTVKVTSRTVSVPGNGTASVSIKTAARATCAIDVEYKSGPSRAAGLGDKTASATGSITWSWKVGSNTTRGTWPIYITCDLGDRTGSVATSFTVR